MTVYVPKRGDLICLTDEIGVAPQVGVHPLALVLSPVDYYVATGFLLCCVVASESVGYPFEVIIGDLDFSVVLSDQLFSVSKTSASFIYVSSLSADLVREVIGKLTVLLTVA